MALIDSVSAGSVSGNAFTTGAIDTTGANFLVAAVSSYSGAAAPTPSDSKSNTWTALTEEIFAGAVRIQLFYVDGTPNVGSGHTFSIGSSSTFASLAAAAFSSMLTSGAFDAESAGANGSSSTIQPGSLSPAGDDELFLTAVGTDAGAGTESIGSSFNIIEDVDWSSGNHIGLAFAYKQQTTGGAENPTWSLGSALNAAAVMAAFKSAGGGGGGGGHPAIRRLWLPSHRPIEIGREGAAVM